MNTKQFASSLRDRHEHEAADRLEDLNQHFEAYAEANRLKPERTATVNQQLIVRSEPSRLEIAAILLAALASRENESWEAKLEVIWAIEQADELIALAKEKK